MWITRTKKGLRLNYEIQSKVERSNCEYQAVPVRNSFSSSADAKREEFLDWWMNLNSEFGFWEIPKIRNFKYFKYFPYRGRRRPSLARPGSRLLLRRGILSSWEERSFTMAIWKRGNEMRIRKFKILRKLKILLLHEKRKGRRRKWKRESISEASREDLA